MREFIEQWADQIGDWIRDGISWVWKKVAYEWSVADTEGRIKIGLIVLVAVLLLFQCGNTKAAELGPDVDVSFITASAGITNIDGRTDPTVVLKYLHSWSPFDAVVEASTHGSITFMAAKGIGDYRLMGGFGLQSGASNLAPTVGVDYKKFSIRLSRYSKSTSGGPFIPVKYCRWSPPPTPTNITKDHTAIYVGLNVPLGAK